MDLNLVVGSSVPSLQSLCAISLASYLLLDKNINPDRRQNYASALTCIDALHYPSILKKILSHHLLIIHENVISWTNKFGQGFFGQFRPVVSISGTVDYYSTAKRIVDDKKIGRFERFVVACVFCLEESIFQIGGQMSKEELDKVKSNLTSAVTDSYWITDQLEVIFTGESEPDYGWNDLLNFVSNVWFKAVLDGGRDYLTREECITALHLALQYNSGFDVKFFAEKLSTEDCTRCILMNIHFNSMEEALVYTKRRYHYSVGSNYLEFQTMKPETFILLLNKLSPTNQQRLMPIFALLVLSSILALPNSEIFKKALTFFGSHLIPQTYWMLVLQTCRKLSSFSQCEFEILDVLWNLVAKFEHISPELKHVLRTSSWQIQRLINDHQNNRALEVYIKQWQPLLQKYLSKIQQLLKD